MQVLSGLLEVLSSPIETDAETQYRCGGCHYPCAVHGYHSSTWCYTWRETGQMLPPLLTDISLLLLRAIVAVGTLVHGDSMMRTTAVDIGLKDNINQRQRAAVGKVAEAAQDVLQLLG